ncbi:Cystatin [Trichuris trichiura]|uniref:Cystatin n=1 Tax=Trichuris trichiura TaxID=36087 RepID=A0A077Z044_TRITR|nr:Cystatin [Trichuris trichiura]
MAIVALLFMVALVVCNASLLGGPSTMDPTSVTARDIAHKALADRNAKSNDLYHDTLIKIVEVTSQVVNGINYNMKMYIGQSKCTKKDVKPDDVKNSKCDLSNSNSAEKCTVKVYDQPWTNTFKVNEFSCETTTKQEALKA